MGESALNTQIDIGEVEKTKTLYHQTIPESAQEIVQSGFRKGYVGGGDMGQQGFIRGTFFKESPDLLDTPKLGRSQVKVELKPDAQVLNLTEEYPASFVQEKSAWTFPGRQAFALAGWLERNGYVELADQYHEGIRRVYSLQPADRLNDVWPIVEQRLKELGYAGVRFTDINRNGQGVEEKFPATVVFDPAETVIVKK